MNTQGHHRVADEAGIGRLNAAFKAQGINDVNLTAFYFGNWLTDLSQVIDPNANCLSFLAKEIGKRIENEAGPIVAALHAYVEEQVGSAALSGTASEAVKDVESIKQMISGTVTTAGRQLTEMMQQLMSTFATLAKSQDQSGGFNDFLATAVKFAAYAKFAHPHPSRQEPALDFDLFVELFNRNFTQSFPHEHLDRPQCRFTRDADCKMNWGKHSETNPDRLYANKLASGEQCIGSDVPSIYEYLEEARRVVSGSLASIDRDWAAKYFTTGADLRTDRAFHFGLADLGHSLHAVEDFFAHSNFIEHAAATRGEAYLREQLYRSGPPESTAREIVNEIRSEFATTKVLRRLKRFEPEVEQQEEAGGWESLSDEYSIVTGYYDCWDTMMSLLHVLEELFEFEEPETVLDPITRYAQEAKKHPFDELNEPITEIAKTIQNETVEGKLRRELRALLDFYSKSGQRLDQLDAAAANQEIRRKIECDQTFVGVPQAMLDVVVKLVYVLVDYRLIKIQTGRVAWNLFKLIKAVLEIFKNPLAFLVEPLNLAKKEGVWFNTKFVAEEIYKIFFDARFDATRFKLRTWLHAMLGGYRIGSHSLLAKDYYDEPLFPQAFNCARALHWYVVDTLCRWSDPEWVKNAAEGSTWVDWHELLGNFLKHPRSYVEEPVSKRVPVTITGYELDKVAKNNETFRSIAESWSGRNNRGGTRQYGTYEQILLSNLSHPGLFQYGTIAGAGIDEARVADLVVTTGMGSREGMSYQLRVGLTVWVPFTTDIMIDRLESSSWFVDMMDLTTDKWLSQIATYIETKSTMSQPSYQYHRAKYFQPIGRESDTSVRDRFIDEGTALRRELEEKYGILRAGWRRFGRL